MSKNDTVIQLAHSFSVANYNKAFSHTGPEVSSAESTIPQYTVETLVIAVVAGSVAALVVGFATGYLCGRKCHKDDDDNLPYPDTEYEYFEQRQNVNRYTADFLKKLLQLTFTTRPYHLTLVSNIIVLITLN